MADDDSRNQAQTWHIIQVVHPNIPISTSERLTWHAYNLLILLSYFMAADDSRNQAKTYHGI